MIELRHLRYFLAVAEELHFGRAAARLHIAQPGLSQQIQALEHELGAMLLDRTRRRVELTPAGQLLYDEGRRLTAQLERLFALVGRTARGQVGRLAIGVVESATYVELPRLLRAYKSAYPDTELVVKEMSSPAQVDALRRGTIDVGLLRTPIESEGLTSRTIRAESLSVLLPRGHRLAKRRMVTLSAIAGEPLIVHPRGRRPNWSDFMLSLCRAAGFEPRVVEEADDTAIAICFVAAGLGVTLVPDTLAFSARPGVVARPVADPTPATSLVLVHPGERSPPTVEALMELAAVLWPAQPASPRRGAPGHESPREGVANARTESVRRRR
jgi:DNA-binding transcriptional LysR family regulator